MSSLLIVNTKICMDSESPSNRPTFIDDRSFIVWHVKFYRLRNIASKQLLVIGIAMTIYNLISCGALDLHHKQHIWCQ